MHNDVKKILVSSEEITKREKELADEISKYYKEKNEMIRQIKGLYLVYRDTFAKQKVYNIWQTCDSCFNRVVILSANKKAEYKGKTYNVIEVEVS